METLLRALQTVEAGEPGLRALVEVSPLGIVVMDPQGDPVFYNPRCVELHGLTLEAARHGGWANAVHPDDRERVVSSWHAAARDGRPWSDTYRFVHPSGEIVWVSGRVAPIRVSDRVVAYVGTLEDVTGLKRAQQDLERAVRARDEVLSIVAHDLRDPLNSVSLAIESLLRRPLDAPAREAKLVSMQRAVGAMDRLINDLLDAARIEAGRLELRHSAVDLYRLIEDVLEAHAAQARERRVTLERECSPALAPASGDKDRLGQVFSNLIGNALKFLPAGGRVRVSAELHEDGLLVSVSDNGPGIPAASLPRLFERFWQADPITRAGAGLGLAIARGIVEAHGGRIWVESATDGPQRGTAVRFTLAVNSRAGARPLLPPRS